MKKKEIVRSLLGLEKAIRDCYQKLCVSGFCEDILEKIKNYKVLEQEMFERLYRVYSSSGDISNLKDFFLSYYGVFDEISSLYMYTLSLDKNIEVKRVLNKLSSDLFCDEEDLMSFSANVIVEDQEEDDEDIEIVSDYFDYEKNTLKMLIEYEDMISCIRKIDGISSFDLGDRYSLPLDKNFLKKVKYDLIFLNDNLDTMFSGDFILPTYFDTKRVAAIKFGLFDEQIDKYYDIIRIEDILQMFDVLSQKKNQGEPSVQNSLRYFLLDLWMNTLADMQFMQVIIKLGNIVNNSYNQSIMEARKHVYKRLMDMYSDRIQSCTYLIEEKEKVKIMEKDEK